MISGNVLREMGMDKLTGYILLTLYVGAIVAALIGLVAPVFA